MRIYTKAGDLAFSTFTFPDGQPHFKLETHPNDDGWREVTIETSIRNPDELFTVLLAGDTLLRCGYSVALDVRYLLGARMDRCIDAFQPFTLDLVARAINSAGFRKVRLLDVHSEAATRLIINSVNLLPHYVLGQVRATLGSNLIVVAPDRGAVNRVETLCPVDYVVKCEKVRDMVTGRLSGFRVNDPSVVEGHDILIVDDICDGGGTFTGLAKELRLADAKTISLFVTHGIFSKGLPLDGIEKVFTTDSYYKYATGREFKNTTVIPISMKEMV